MTKLTYSQNYLNSKTLVRRLVQKAQIGANDHVIEIGPGKGIITDALSLCAKKVTAVEYDFNLYAQLIKNHCATNVIYIHDDFLNYPLPKKGKYKVFSNIPFQITSEIILKLTEAKNPPTDIFLIMQKEAAKKYCGRPFQKYEGLRASILKPQYEMHIMHKFAPADFTPVPDVEIILVHFKKKNMDMLPEEYREYKDFVSYFYTAPKGSSAKERLQAVFSPKQIYRLAKELHFDTHLPYTMISAVQWERLYRYSQIWTDAARKGQIRGSYQRHQRQQRGLKKQHRTRSGWKR